MTSCDLAIIGSGPGGYVAALYAARHGMRVCVIEKGEIGGTCLNRGCIPTKSFLNAASFITDVPRARASGIDIEGCRADFPRLLARKNEVVQRLRNGIETLFRSAKIDLIRGTASLSSPGVIAVNGTDAVRAKDIIIAAGSGPTALPGIAFDGTSILSSDAILDIAGVPRSLIIIGGGVIGCEFACIFNALGAAVTIIELTDRLIPTQSKEASRRLEQAFKKRGIVCRTSTAVSAVTASSDGSDAAVTTASGPFAAEKVLVSIGRSPHTTGLGLADAGVKTEGGRIMVDEELRTTAPHIYAIGDCVIGPQLAHKASYDGILACDNILGRVRKVDYSVIPSCIWTDPQIASVGLTEDDARARLTDIKIAKFPFLASGKAYLAGQADGFVKIIGDSAGAIIGVEIVGPDACELINEAVLAKTARIPIAEWSRSVHGHPTLSEALQEAAHVFCGTGIHSV